MAERQLGGIVRTAPAGHRQRARAPGLWLEQMGHPAVLISESTAMAALQGAAAVANVQRAASRYLQQLLGMDPQALALDARGLHLSDPDHQVTAGTTAA